MDQEPEVRYTPLEDILADRFSRYSKHIIQERALPDARDGLKPVQRRILWAMYEAHNTYDHPYHKSAKTVGNVIGNYHPHGDISVYETMIRLSQDWKIRTPLVDVQGNNGSIDNDPPAAMRYTEARLSKLSNYLLEDIDKETVAWTPNFSDEKEEPVVLPARYPNLLVNGISGIAAGYATNIPPHNLNEVISATIYRIKHPDSTLKQLMRYIKGPDFPTGAIAMGEQGMEEAFRTGRGKVIVRAKAHIENKKALQQIVIDEIPYEVVKSNLVKKITDLHLAKKIDGIMEVRDESGREGLRIVIDIKKEANAQAILDYLYKNTELQTSVNYNVVAIVHQTPMTLSLAEMLDAFIEHREEVVLNRSRFTLNAREKRAHIVEGLMKAISILDELLKLIRASKDKADAKKRMMARWNFSEAQAEAIVTLQLYRLSNTDIQALEKEKVQLEKEIEELKEIIEDKNVRNNLMIKELRQVSREFSTPRKTQIEPEILEIKLNPKDMVAREDFIVSVSKDGYLKKSSLRSFRTSNSLLPGLREGDVPLAISKLSSLDNLLILTDRARVFILPVYRIEESRWKDNGIHLSSLVRLESNEKILKAFVGNGQDLRNTKLALAARNGLLAKVKIDEPLKEKNPALLALSKDNRLAGALLLEENQSVLFVSKKGQVLHANIESISAVSKTKGIKGLTLKPDDLLHSFLLAQAKNYLLITASGKAQKIALEEIPLKNRGGQGISLLEKEEEVVFFLPFDAPLTFYDLKENRKITLSPNEMEAAVPKGEGKPVAEDGRALILMEEFVNLGLQSIV